MSNDKIKVLDQTEDENAQPSPKEKKQEPKKKINLRFHLVLVLILGVSTWTFITYSQTVKDWKQQWYDFTHQPTQNDSATTQRVEPIVDKASAGAESLEPIENTPIFEEAPELKDIETIDSINAESLEDLSALVGQIQQQLTTIQENMSQMYNKDVEQSKQQVQAHLFAYLQKATFNHTSIEDTAIAWKSISLLPLIDAKRRTQAEQAWSELYGIHKDIQTLNQEIKIHIFTLAKKMQPEALAEVILTSDSLIDMYTNDDNTSKTWLEWLEEQFKLTKVDSNALEISADPYADIKFLIQELERLKYALNTKQWQDSPDIKALVHQLTQYGIETSISQELVNQMQQTQRSWHEQSRLWMEQL